MVSLGRIILYAKDVDETVRFYETHFVAHREAGIISSNSFQRVVSAILMLHPATKGQRVGQSIVKLVFDVETVEEFCAKRAEEGLVFGTVHLADGYTYANAYDVQELDLGIKSGISRLASFDRIVQALLGQN